MTIEEAIKHCLEVAGNHERHAKILDKRLLGSGLNTVDDCLQCAADHRQLAEWLRELVIYKQLRICGNCRHYVGGTTHFGECHVTSDIEPCVVSVSQTACDTFFDYKDLEMESKNNDTQ